MQACRDEGIRSAHRRAGGRTGAEPELAGEAGDDGRRTRGGGGGGEGSRKQGGGKRDEIGSKIATASRLAGNMKEIDAGGNLEPPHSRTAL